MPLANSRFASGALTLIEEIILAAPAVTIDFDNIPATFKSLKLVGLLRSSEVAAQSNLNLRINGDVGLNYDRCLASVNPGATLMVVTGTAAQVQMFLSDIPGTTGLADSFGAIELEFPGYALATQLKNVIQHSGYADPGAGGYEENSGTGRWRSLAAINRLVLESIGFNLIAGSRATLYGLT